MKIILFFILTMTLIALPSAPGAFAWGPQGHAVVGNAAVATVSPPARAKIMDILQASSTPALTAAVEEACFWPDTVRDSPDWSWSSPLHYVNLPRSSDHYDRQRDCPESLCVTEGILRYAAELGRTGIDRGRRRQAFAWLCHLVADLHQPLHAGFRDDRGGNTVDIQYRGERSNLHRFWDSMLAKQRLAELDHGGLLIDGSVRETLPATWNPDEIVAWTEESHALAAARAYPSGPVVNAEFADASWVLIQQQWLKAAARLARILDAVLVDEDSPRG